MRLAVRVTPRGGRDSVEGWARDDAGRPVLRVRVAAAAADGQANASVIAVLAKALGLPKSSVRIVRGETARVKQLDLADIEPQTAWARLGAPPSDL